MLVAWVSWGQKLGIASALVLYEADSRSRTSLEAKTIQGQTTVVLQSVRTRIGPALLDEYFLVLPIRGLRCGSFESSLGNTVCLEGNIATVIFQYSIVR